MAWTLTNAAYVSGRGWAIEIQPSSNTDRVFARKPVSVDGHEYFVFGPVRGRGLKPLPEGRAWVTIKGELSQRHKERMGVLAVEKKYRELLRYVERDLLADVQRIEAEVKRAGGLLGDSASDMARALGKVERHLKRTVSEILKANVKEVRFHVSSRSHTLAYLGPRGRGSLSGFDVTVSGQWVGFLYSAWPGNGNYPWNFVTGELTKSGKLGAKAKHRTLSHKLKTVNDAFEAVKDIIGANKKTFYLGVAK